MNIICLLMWGDHLHAKEFGYITPLLLNEIGRMNIVYEEFVITETRDAYTSILEYLFQMSTYRITYMGICNIF